MKLNVNFEIFDLADKALPERANKYLAGMLMEHKGDSLKLFELAMSINKNDSVEVDTSDLKLIEEAVKSNPQYNNMIKGAILKEIESQKVSDKQSKKADS